MRTAKKTSKSIDQFLAMKDKHDVRAKDAEQILKCHKESIDRAKGRQREKDQMGKVRSENAINLRNAKTEEIVAKLSDLLSQSNIPPAFQQDLVQFEVKPVSDGAKTIRAWFACSFVDSIMEPIMKAPSSKGTKKNVQDAADKIIGHFELLTSKGFLDLRFLSEELPESDPLRPLLLKHFNNDKTRRHFLRKLSLSDIEEVENGKLFQVFEWLLSGWRNKRQDDIPTMDQVIVRHGIIPSALGPWTKHDNETKKNDMDIDPLSIGYYLWTEKSGDQCGWSGPREAGALERSKAYLTCVAEISKVYQAFVDFLQHPELLRLKQRMSATSYTSFRASLHYYLDDVRKRDFGTILKYLKNSYG